MDRRHLEYFLAIVDTGSFTRAATALRVTQPSLSHAMGALERELASGLFERSGRGVRLTPAGEALVEPARRVLRSFAVARGAVRTAAEGGRGRLTVIANTLWALDPLVAVLGEFRQSHPGVELLVSDPGSRSEVLDRVRSGEFQFGLVDGIAPTGMLGSRWLVDHELVAVLPPHDARPGASVGVADLVPLGLICTPRGTALRGLLDDQLERVGLPSEVTVETAHLASVVPLVLAGAGAALLPGGLAAEAAARGARVLGLQPPARAAVSLVWRAHRLSGLEQHFLGVVDELFTPVASGTAG
jgi:LysR family carnitine catabolism transcriptional activator